MWYKATQNHRNVRLNPFHLASAVGTTKHDEGECELKKTKIRERLIK